MEPEKQIAFQGYAVIIIIDYYAAAFIKISSWFSVLYYTTMHTLHMLIGVAIIEIMGMDELSQSPSKCLIYIDVL